MGRGSKGVVGLIPAHPDPPRAVVVDVAGPVAAGDVVCGVRWQMACGGRGGAWCVV